MFLHYWYWHSVRSRPLAFARKIARQLGVFYSTNCPAFFIKKIPTAWTYPASFSTLSDSQSPRLFCFLKTRTLLWIGRQQRFRTKNARPLGEEECTKFGHEKRRAAFSGIELEKQTAVRI